AMPREQRGTHSIVRTSLRVIGRATLDWWAAHLDDNDVLHSGVIDRDGRLTLDLEDPEGQRLSLVDDGGRGDKPTAWEQSPVPTAHQIRGLGPILMSVPDIKRTEPILTRVMGMEHKREYQSDLDSPH